MRTKRISATSVVPFVRRKKMCKVQYEFQYVNGKVSEHSGLFRSKIHFWSFVERQKKIRSNNRIIGITITLLREGVVQ